MNVLHSSISLKQRDKRKLTKHKSDLRNLSSTVVFITKKKQVVQKGRGFLPLLLGPVLSFRTPLLLKGNNHGWEDSVCKRNNSQDTKSKTDGPPAVQKEGIELR